MPYEAVTEEVYTASATAKGGRQGHTTTADGVIDLPLGKPGSTANPKANPESLLAAGWAACFNGALNLMASKEGLDTTESTVDAEVTLGKTESGVGLAVTLTAHVPGVDAETAQRLADAADTFCPYSKATRGNIDVKVIGLPA